MYSNKFDYKRNCYHKQKNQIKKKVKKKPKQQIISYDDNDNDILNLRTLWK